MNWQQVTVCCVLIVGGVVLGVMGKETLAASALGAAAGYLIHPLLQNNHK